MVVIDHVHRSRFSILFYCLFISLSCFGSQKITLELDLQNINACLVALSTSDIKPFTIKKITYDADISLTSNEIDDFIGLREGMEADKSTFERICQCLACHKRLNKVKLNISDSDGNVHVEITGNYIVGTVKVTGGYFFQELYRILYKYAEGDRFDQQAHEKIVHEMEHALYDKGYRNVHVLDTVTFDEKNKKVDVALKINLGKVSVVDAVAAQVVVKGESYDSSLDELINSYARKHIKKMVFNQDNIVKQERALTDRLCKHGYVPSRIIFNVEHEQVKPAKVLLKLEVYIEPVLFEGNHFFSNEELARNVLRDHDLGANSFEHITKELVQAYKNKGFWSASITIEQKDGWRTIHIDEGSRVRIKDILLEGIERGNLSVLKTLVKPMVKQYYDAEKEKQVLGTLKKWYERAGFWDVRLLKTEYIKLGNTDEFELIVVIDEGEQRFLASVTVDGYPHLSLPHTPISKKEKYPFDMALVAQHTAWLENYFAQQGYAYVKVDNELIHEGNDVHLVWKVTLPKEQTRFGKTVVNYAGKLPYKYIARQLCYKEGDVWDGKKVECSLKQLSDLDVFDIVSCEPISSSLDNDSECSTEHMNDHKHTMLERPYLLSLREKDPLLFRLDFGWEQLVPGLPIQEPLTFFIAPSLLWRNSTNHADYVRFDTRFTDFYRQLRGEYRLPWIGGTPMSIGIQGYDNKYKQSYFFDTNRLLYEITDVGFGLDLSYDLPKGLFGVRGGVQSIGFDEAYLFERQLARTFELSPCLINRKKLYGIIEPYFAFNFVDNLPDPTRGVILSGSCKFFNERGINSCSFGKLITDVSVFVPLGPTVLACHAGFGHIFNAPRYEIPLSERFFLGGLYTLRGYEQNGAPPHGCIFVQQNQDLFGAQKKVFGQLVPQGGTSMMNGSLELRFPIFRALSGVLFQDIGFLSKDIHTLFKCPLYSTGFGLRVGGEAGILRFNVAWKWHERIPGDSRAAISLFIGQSF